MNIINYYGFNFNGKTVTFPAPPYPSCGYGIPYAVGTDEDNNFYTITKDNVIEKLGDKVDRIDYLKYIKEGSWRKFPSNPFIIQPEK